MKKLLLIVGFILLVLLLSYLNAKPKPMTTNTDPSSAYDRATGDTTAETVRVLTQKVNQVNAINQSLAEHNQSLQNTMGELQQDLLSIKEQNNTAVTKDYFEQFQYELSQLRAEMNAARTNDGYRDYSQTNDINNHSWQWLSPLDQITPDLLEHLQINSTSNQQEKVMAPAEPQTLPQYTLPVGATLFDGITMSALIGRIPIRGTVVSPYTFKAMVGNENLAANGIMIPNLNGIIAVGKVTGDMQLSCNRAEVYALTFVFQDGRISTTEQQSSEPLGELSTQNGNPCIPGKFYTNAPKHLGTLGLLGATEGAASAYADAQLRKDENIFGGTRQNVTGSSTKYVLGQSGKQAARDVKQWWLERHQNSFDAVYTPAGTAVVINILQQLDIDYDFQGRKTHYADSSDQNIQALLD